MNQRLLRPSRIATGVMGVYCCFCNAELEGVLPRFLALCPECEARLLDISPLRPEYPWFVAAVRRALFGV
ncbi:MAG: hypothetical protein GX592_03245 [Clostridiales bacterium]|nr:hypothetical protein [Clostridiales bacterium]